MGSDLSVTEVEGGAELSGVRCAVTAAANCKAQQQPAVSGLFLLKEFRLCTLLNGSRAMHTVRAFSRDEQLRLQQLKHLP